MITFSSVSNLFLHGYIDLDIPQIPTWLSRSIHKRSLTVWYVCIAVDQQSCSQSFDVMFRRCLNHIPMVAENFFSVVADQADNRTMKSVCDDSYSSMIQRCSHGAVQELKVTNTQCNKQEITQVRQNVKDTMSAYDEKCKFYVQVIHNVLMKLLLKKIVSELC